MKENYFKYDSCPICNGELDICELDTKPSSLVELYRARRKGNAICNNKCYEYEPINVNGDQFYFVTIFNKRFSFSPYSDIKELRVTKEELYNLIKYWRENDRYLIKMMGCD